MKPLFYSALDLVRYYLLSLMIGLEAVKMDFSDCYQYFPQTTTCSSPSQSPVLDQEAPLLTCLSFSHSPFTGVTAFHSRKPLSNPNLQLFKILHCLTKKCKSNLIFQEGGFFIYPFVIQSVSYSLILFRKSANIQKDVLIYPQKNNKCIYSNKTYIFV